MDIKKLTPYFWQPLTYDTDANTYFAGRVSLGDTVPVYQKLAYSKCLVALKAINLIQPNFYVPGDLSTSILKGFWSFCNNGTDASDKLNILSPVDADANYRLSFGGTTTASTTGRSGNASTGFADTFLIPSTALAANDTSIGVFIVSNPTTLGEFAIGSRTSSTQLLALRPYNTDNKVTTFQYNTTAGAGYLDTTNTWVKNNLGATIKQAVTKMVISNRYLTKNQLLINGVLDADTTNNGGTIPDKKIYIFGYNNAGTLASPTALKIGLAFVGKGMSVAAAQAFTTACDNLMKDLRAYPFTTSINGIGDSIMWGQSAPNVTTPMTVLKGLYSSPSNVVTNNFGVSGKKLLDMITDYAANEGTYYFDKFDNNILILHAGVNDLGQDLACTVADLQGRYVSYCALAKATGFKVLIDPLYPQSNPAYSGRTNYEAERQTINAWMRSYLLANGLVDGVVNSDLNVNIGLPGCQDNALYYISSTKIHPTDAGNAEMAMEYKNAIGTLLGTNI